MLFSSLLINNKPLLLEVQVSQYFLLLHQLIEPLTELYKIAERPELPQDKSYRVVIRGLHNMVATDDISQELTDRGFRVRKITNFISRDKISLPLYFVDLEPSVNNSI
jgi:hypothetical protein